MVRNESHVKYPAKNLNMINSYTSWQPLEEVIVGRAYTPDYFDFIDNAQVRNQLQQILIETDQDLDNLQRTIEQYGARVHRPSLMDKDKFPRTRSSVATVDSERLANHSGTKVAQGIVYRRIR